MSTLITSLLRSGVAALMALALAAPCLAVADLYIRDTVSDAGAEPYSGPGPVYLSPDIWVRNGPDANWEPYPYPTAAPTWTPAAHQNPEYRDSKSGQPNYIYVRIHNRGDEASSGTERLRLYQAKASTGLAWPASWVDNMGTACGASRLLGIEVTKPRRNAQSVSAAERDAYRDALLAIQTDSSFQYADGSQYWRKQNAIHATAGNPQHGNPAFLAWHREMLNRYEERLRESNPLLTLLYWDWTVDPRSGTNLFTTSFMGESNGTVANPLVPLRPPILNRDVAGTSHPSCTGFSSDASLLALSNFPDLGNDIESTPNHNCAHGYIGGNSGQISALSTAVHDPFFFLLHGNVDRLWANWQRRDGNPMWLDPVATYGSDSSHVEINDTMSPWDGATGMAPWTGAAAYGKTSKHRSVVYPPIYDTAPLNIPVLQPGESVVMEIPWYPPDVNDYNCAGQAGHFCLLARIETATTAPFGMTFPEIINVGTNTRNNNNIAWKNVTIVDDQPDAGTLRFMTGTLIRNIFDRDASFEIALVDRTARQRFQLAEQTRLSLVLPREIFARTARDDVRLTDLKPLDSRSDRHAQLQVTGKTPRLYVPLKANESFIAELHIELPRGNIPSTLLGEPFHLDIEQRIDLPEQYFTPRPTDTLLVGGVRFTTDFRQLMDEAKDDQADLGDGARPRDLEIRLRPAERRMLSTQDMADGGPAPSVQHFAVGEPLDIEVLGGDAAEGTLSLTVDGEEVATGDAADGITDILRFEAPGVHIIETRGVDADGQEIVRRSRVLVSEHIPPIVVINSPEPGTEVQAGQEVVVQAEAVAQFGREIRTVSLYVKEGDTFVDGMNLVISDNYQPADQAEGGGRHAFRFTPDKPGKYMLQVGAVDNREVTGVSGHVMIRVLESDDSARAVSMASH